MEYELKLEGNFARLNSERVLLRFFPLVESVEVTGRVCCDSMLLLVLSVLSGLFIEVPIVLIDQ